MATHDELRGIGGVLEAPHDVVKPSPYRLPLTEAASHGEAGSDGHGAPERE